MVPRPYVFYRITANSKSSNTKRLEKMALKVINQAFSAAPESLKYIKKYRLGSFYRYMSCRALETLAINKSRLFTAKMLWKAVFWSPGLLCYPPMGKALLKYLAIALLPTRASNYLLQKIPKLNNTSTLMSYRPAGHPKF